MSVAQAIALYEAMPTMEGLRLARILRPGKAGRAFGYHHGCGHGHTPRTKA